MSTLRNRTKRDPQRSGMTHAKWREVQTVYRKSAARVLHESCQPVPVSIAHPHGIAVTGGTYNLGRNAAKRAHRARKKDARAEYLRTQRDVLSLGRMFGIYP